MSATASRIALGVPAHPISVPEPSAVASGAGRGTPRRDHGGRFVPRATYPCCEGCGWVLAEDLAGRLYCPDTHCKLYRQSVGAAPGVDAGTVTAEVLAVGK